MSKVSTHMTTLPLQLHEFALGKVQFLISPCQLSEGSGEVVPAEVSRHLLELVSEIPFTAILTEGGLNSNQVWGRCASFSRPGFPLKKRRRVSSTGKPKEAVRTAA